MAGDLREGGELGVWVTGSGLREELVDNDTVCFGQTRRKFKCL